MPKIVDHNNYRQELLEKSLNLFTRKGYSNVNMKEIANEIGVSTGTLYHYFPSKVNILAEMMAWIADKNISDYYRRSKSVESIRDRFDMVTGWIKENGEFYEKTLLLAFDFFRNSNIQQYKEVYTLFSDLYADAWSERMNISRQFARFIFIFLIGLSFHSLAFDERSEFNNQVDFLDELFSPIIVNGSENLEKAAKKIKAFACTELLKKPVSTGTTAVKKDKKNMAKKAMSARKSSYVKKQRNNKR
ncbi:MAG: TetR/AcrR family transcriptional regulator [Syntrophaceae bacterium]|nr:TetR/AcrR family transcriptional regulator [Syntrophaceae bacterium]